MTKKLSQEFSRTEKSRNLGARSKLDEFFLNLQVRVKFCSVPETSQNTSRENQEPTEDRSQIDPHPEARVSLSQSSQDCCPDDAYDNGTCYSKYTACKKPRR